MSLPLGSGKLFAARIGGDPTTIHFDVFDSQHNLLSERNVAATEPPVNGLAVVESFQSRAPADLNRDGNPDLVAVFSSTLNPGGLVNQDGIIVFLSNGDGTFQTGKRQVLTSNPSRNGPSTSVAIADLNGDGIPDLVLGTPTDPSNSAPDLAVALGNGDGTFTVKPTSIMNLLVSYRQGSFTLADVKGDGKADLIVSGAFASDQSSVVAVAAGNGDGTFQPARLFPALNGFAIAGGDVNGDGFPDLVTAGGTILFGDGTGNFPSLKDYVFPQNGSVTLLDFDGDGNTDIVFSSNTLTVLFGDGTGAFTAAPISAPAISSPSLRPAARLPRRRGLRDSQGVGKRKISNGVRVFI